MNLENWTQGVGPGRPVGLCSYSGFSLYRRNFWRTASGELPDSFEVHLFYECGTEVKGEKIIDVDCNRKNYRYYSGYTDRRPPWRGLMDTHDFALVRKYTGAVGQQNSQGYEERWKNESDFHLEENFHVANAFIWFCS